MANSVKNRIMRVLAVIAIVCVGMVFAFAAQPAKATQNIAAADEFAMQADAGIYIGDSEGEAVEGIAFKTDVSETYFNTLEEGAQFYTIVTAEKFLTDGDITSLTVESVSDMDAVTIKPADYANFSEGVWTYLVTITYDSETWTAEQFEEAYETKLVARSYVRLADGTVIYAQNDTEATSIRETASAELKDALDNDVILSDTNVAKFDQYVGREDVNAYFEEDYEIKFIDQNLNGADVYVVNEYADGYDFVGRIEDGELFATEFALTGTAGTQTEVVISAKDGAFFAPVTEVTEIIENSDEFLALFGNQYADANDILDTIEAYLNTEGADWTKVFATRPSGTYAGKQHVNASASVLQQTLDGYYVLGADLDMSSVTYNPYIGVSMAAINSWLAANPASKIQALITAGTIDFTGNGTQSYVAPNNRTLALGATFDGLGHSLVNLAYKQGYGLIGKVDGTIKNLGIINATLSGASSGTIIGTNAGTRAHLENLYIQVSSVGLNTNLAGNRQAGLFQRMDYGHYKNIVIEYPDVNASFAGEYGLGYLDYMGYPNTADQNVNTSTNNVIAITKTLALGAYTNKSTTTSGRRVALASNDADVTSINGVALKLTDEGGTFSSVTVVGGVSRYDDYDALKDAEVDLSAFDNGLWDISTGAPVWLNKLETSVVVTPSELVFEASEEITSKEISVTSDLIDIDVKYEVEDTSVVTVNNGVVTVVDPYIGGSTVITYSYAIAGKTFTGSIPVTVLKVKPVLGSFAVSAKNDAIPADLIKAVDGNITAIYATNDLTTNLLEAGKFNFDNATTAVITKEVVVVCDNGKEYAATLDIYTDVITTASEFAATEWRTGTGAYALGADIDLAGTNVAGMGASNVWTGLFDGRGYVVDNLSAPARGIFGQTVGKKSIIKNVAFTNVVLPGGSAYCVFAWSPYQVTFQDIYVQVVSITAQRNGAIAGMMGGVYMNNSVIEFPEYNPNGPAIPVGEAAKDVANWAGVKGYTNETAVDQGGGILESNYYPYYSGNYVTADHYMSTTQGEQMKMSNVIAVSKTPALLTRYGQGFFVYAENEYYNYINADGSWKTDSAGTSYGDYFTLKTKKGTTTATTVGGLVFSKGIVRYDDYAALRNAELDLSAFETSGMWDTSTGAPVWAGIAIPSVEIIVDGKADATEVRISEDAETATFDITSKLVNVTFTADIADKTIATYANGVITKVANGGATVLNYSYTVAGKTIKGSLPVVIEKAYAKLGTIIIDNDTTELTGLAVDGNIVSVKDLSDGTEYFVDGDITLTNNTDRVISVVVIITTDAGKEYKATLEVYTAIINDFAEFNQIFGYQTYNLTVTQAVKNDATGDIVWEKTLSTENADDMANYFENNGAGTFKFAYDGVVGEGFTRVVDVYTMTAKSLGGAYILADDIEVTESDAKTWDPYTHVNFKPQTMTGIKAENADGTETYKYATHNTYLGEYRHFTGTFNGNGYVISGMDFNGDRGGFFGITDGAIIKNVGFTNVTFSGTHASVIGGNNINTETTIENVYIEVVSWIANGNANRSGALYQYWNVATTKSFNMSNVVVVAPTETATSTYTNGALWSHPGNGTQTAEAENVIVISGTKWLGNYNNSRVSVAENSTYTGTSATNKINGIFHYDDIDGAITAGKTVVGNWVISETGIAWADSVDAGSAEQSKN